MIKMGWKDAKAYFEALHGKPTENHETLSHGNE
jgi:hypothetical protein